MSAHIGKRLRDIRKRRGMSQRELAKGSGVLLSLIRKLEQGERADTRLETARQLAVALGVPTTQLVAEEAADRERAVGVTVDQWGGVRQALLAPGPSDDLDEPPTVDGLRAAVESAQPLFSGDKLAELSTILPPLIRDAAAVAESGPEGRAVQMRVMQLTGWLLTQTRQFEAAEVALERSLDASSDRLQSAVTVSTQCWLLLRCGKLSAARELAIRWADEAEPRMSRATPAEMSAWGWLLLRASAASIRDNRPGEAADALRLANSAAVALGREFAPDNDFLRAFGPVTVALKRTENAMVVDRPDLVLKLAPKIPAKSMRPTSNNRNRHLLDVANAHARTRRYGEAVEILQSIRARAPQWLPNQRYAQDILGLVVAKRRTLTPEMRSLADAIGLPL
ncbi:helix-turn-helix protein [Streptomyces sp. 2333.5]|uniref:helix-turn-helix domain-containing protein n=1 Tax=unclassified Streptomyces TaxID=2593676 RepID=UPI000896A076|nr:MULTISPECIES: helix-turn-helix transcriptional regulator [unclassified Streptomyces]PJJ02395.1 helix-turn-helix protein [Streptomyces sp. 2333.5]SED08115.1 Helix-turn-helix domain-containing protein [Streptomyces sp. 2314.4]SED95122.1 Helix-turn-helix domain-containing protein [Streptomyces sp. 2112.2]